MYFDMYTQDRISYTARDTISLTVLSTRIEMIQEFIDARLHSVLCAVLYARAMSKCVLQIRRGLFSLCKSISRALDGKQKGKIDSENAHLQSISVCC